MAGVKGRSGGARPNSGPKPRKPVETRAADAKEFLTLVMSGALIPSPAQLDAAKALLRAADAGKKSERADAAKRAGAGRFSAAEPPRLVVNN